MLWHKLKHIVPIDNFYGIDKTTPISGLIRHLIIIPDNKHSIWSFDLTDDDNDIIFSIDNHQSRLDFFKGIPVGKDHYEHCKLTFRNVSYSKVMVCIFKIQERW